MKTEILTVPRNNPRDPYGPPMLWAIVKVFDPTYHRPLYIRTASAKGYTFTTDWLYTRHFHHATAQKHAAHLSDLASCPR